MANASILAMKEQHVAEIKDRLTRAQSVVMFDYRGLTVDEVTALRVEMRKAGVEYIVLKNTMVERACRELNIDESQRTVRFRFRLRRRGCTRKNP